MNRVLVRTVQAVALPIALIALWWWVSASSTNFYFPPLRRIVEIFPETWLSGGNQARWWTDVVPSLVRLTIGYGLAVTLGIAGGLLIGSSRTLRALTEPVLEIFRAIPPPATVPLLVTLAGIDNLMKVLVIVFGCVWPILLNTVEGVRAVDPLQSDVCRCYGISGPGRIRSLVLRSASPQIMTGMRQALSVGIILMVISEMFAASNGIGFTVVQFQRTFAIPEMWTGIIVLGLLGTALSLAFQAGEKRVLGWYNGLREAHRHE
jgi:ABC-type nitrate/sulfonate/bicarbonate transport system permease component